MNLSFIVNFKANRFAVLFLLVFILPVALVHALPEEELWVEGISYEPTNPAESIAVINGDFYNVGDVIDGHRIEAISSGQVRVSNVSTGSEHYLRVKGAEEIQAERSPASAAKAADGDDLDRSKMTVGEELEEALKPGATWNPFALLDRAKEMAVIANLRKIYTMANVYYHEEGAYGEDMSIDDLVKARMISPQYKGGVRGTYKYSVKIVGDDVSVSADPVDSNSNMRHFLIDEFGDLYSDFGKPATVKSTSYNV